MRRTLILLGSASLIVWQAPAFAQTCSCPPGAGVASGVVIRADEPPPPLPEYDQPPMPAPDYIWTPGYWAWNNYDYYWVPGTWIEPPRPGLLWTPGYWAFGDGVYAFHRGYWGDHVGFYGGVDYGFGYGGHGYEGGRWENGHFFYNRVVNNFGNVHVTNVYEKNIVINNNNTRISFNGGKGGIEARPTPAEEAAAREQRVPPTRTQVEHARTASMNGALFQSNNHGKPAIAATPRAAAFSGPGVVRAKEGGPITPVNTPQALKPGAEPRPGAGPDQHPPGGAALQRPEGAPAHPMEAPAARPGGAPATHGPEHNAAPSLPQHNGPQDQHAPEHSGAPAQNEPRAEPRAAAPEHEEMRRGPVVEHPPMAPHAEPPHNMAPHAEPPRGAPHMEAPRAVHPEAPAARPEPHPAARPAPPRRGPPPHEPEKRREDR
ncbi:MAG: YXWGXW repeat-containing protein [Proteobacteria bacterium]|nr:YXWGXW repeat-containing protein [Pseudomonadota bacterium]